MAYYPCGLHKNRPVPFSTTYSTGINIETFLENLDRIVAFRSSYLLKGFKESSYIPRE